MERGYNKRGGVPQKIAWSFGPGLMKRVVDLTELNAMDGPAFCAALGGLWEHSPWIAERAAERRPFDTTGELAWVMWSAVLAASDEQQVALLRAHPDLAGKLARAGALTAQSTSEQASLGLDRLGEEEYESFTAMNDAYRERFGFPFIICVRENTKASIRDAFEARLPHTREEEIQIALDEVRKIAEYRLRDRIRD